jgi:cystathionine beta-lyase/cystathionine gamma-synthase
MKKKEVNSARVPVYRDSGFELYDAETTARIFKDETNHAREPELYIYSRYRNPTVVAAEAELMKLEKCDWALLTQSGMSAVDTALSIFQRGKDNRPWLFFTEIYGGTISFMESVLKKRRGLDIHSFNPVNERYDLAEFEKTIKKLRPELVYVETISNPLLIVADVEGIARISGRYGAKVIVDNTFATPSLFKPLNSGADLVIHSATKYFSGHGNLTAGVICGNDPVLMKAAIEYRKFVGHMLSPDDAYRLTTQVKTFELRFARQCENATRLATLLNESPVVKKVYFPGLKNHATHREAVKLLGKKSFGAMITFDFAGNDADEKRKKRDIFIRRVSEKIKLIPTLGDPHTILMPVEAVWGSKYPEPGMIRLSVGFEDYDELHATISSAFKNI